MGLYFLIDMNDMFCVIKDDGQNEIFFGITEDLSLFAYVCFV